MGAWYPLVVLTDRPPARQAGALTAELSGHGGDDGFRSRCLQLDGLALSRLSYATMAPAQGFEPR